MEDESTAADGQGGRKKDNNDHDVVASQLSSSTNLSSSSSSSKRPTWSKVMRQTWARTSNSSSIARLNSKSSTAPALGPAGTTGLSLSAPTPSPEADRKRSKAKERTKAKTKKTRIRIDKLAEERRALTSDFSSCASSSSSSSSPFSSACPSYISSSSSSFREHGGASAPSSRYGTFAQSASATLTTGSARGRTPRGRFGIESPRVGRVSALAITGPWDDSVSWVIDERRPRKVSGEITRECKPQQQPLPQQTTLDAGKEGVRREAQYRDSIDREKAAESEELDSVEAEGEAVDDAGEEKGAFDLLRTYYPHSLASLTSISTKKTTKDRLKLSESDSDEESQDEERTKNVKIASEDDNEREQPVEATPLMDYVAMQQDEALSGKRPRRRRRAASAKRGDHEGRLPRLRAKLCKSGDILLCMRREPSYDDDDGNKTDVAASETSLPIDREARDRRGRSASAGNPQEAKVKKPPTPRKDDKEKEKEREREEREREREREMEREMEELWRRTNKPRRCSEPFAFPSRRSRGSGSRGKTRRDGDNERGSGVRDRSNTISSFVLAFEERKDLIQLARERELERSERKSRWRAYSFITPRRHRNNSNSQATPPSATTTTTTTSPSSSSSAQPPDSSPAAHMVQGRQRSSSLGATRPNVNFIDQPLRQARSLSDDEGGLDDADDDIYGGGGINTFVDIDMRPRPHQQLLLHQQQLKAKRDQRRREEAERKEEGDRAHEGNKTGDAARGEGGKPSWRNLKLLFSSER